MINQPCYKNRIECDDCGISFLYYRAHVVFSPKVTDSAYAYCPDCYAAQKKENWL